VAQKELKEKFKPLIKWLKEETKDVVRDGKSLRTRQALKPLLTIAFLVVISNRLVSSACAVVADEIGYTANLEKLMSKLLSSPNSHPQ
jgi:heat shock protein beta